eukprot:gnl/TRDRNA2_/TRDRNA2_80615_c1_seq1.p1 gnl/TRDRNA2_/TRDRNA2_80615_c1~~gnl/TRDRNA2_/TRDRNA2_80615_c1_seq1.p1  ORF type:complete len:721 (-),score=234.20 gnl/TRDRNA2_/TRDRNA2_80615_c1_seq1:62-2161(-)
MSVSRAAEEYLRSNEAVTVAHAALEAEVAAEKAVHASKAAATVTDDHPKLQVAELPKDPQTVNSGSDQTPASEMTVDQMTAKIAEIRKQLERAQHLNDMTLATSSSLSGTHVEASGARQQLLANGKDSTHSHQALQEKTSSTEGLAGLDADEAEFVKEEHDRVQVQKSDAEGDWSESLSEARPTQRPMELEPEQPTLVMPSHRKWSFEQPAHAEKTVEDEDDDGSVSEESASEKKELNATSAGLELRELAHQSLSDATSMSAVQKFIDAQEEEKLAQLSAENEALSAGMRTVEAEKATLAEERTILAAKERLLKAETLKVRDQALKAVEAVKAMKGTPVLDFKEPKDVQDKEQKLLSKVVRKAAEMTKAKFEQEEIEIAHERQQIVEEKRQLENERASVHEEEEEFKRAREQFVEERHQFAQAVTIEREKLNAAQEMEKAHAKDIAQLAQERLKMEEAEQKLHKLTLKVKMAQDVEKEVQQNEEQHESLPPDWSPHKSHDGHVFYYNEKTHHSQWAFPREPKEATPTPTNSLEQLTPPEPAAKPPTKEAQATTLHAADAIVAQAKEPAAKPSTNQAQAKEHELGTLHAADAMAAQAQEIASTLPAPKQEPRELPQPSQQGFEYTSPTSATQDVDSSGRQLSQKVNELRSAVAKLRSTESNILLQTKAALEPAAQLRGSGSPSAQEAPSDWPSWMLHKLM